MIRRLALCTAIVVAAIVHGPAAAKSTGETEAPNAETVPATAAAAPAAQADATSTQGAAPAAAPAQDPASTPAPDAAAPAPDASGTPAAAPAPDAQFDRKVKGLEERVTDLKEKIYRTKARLLLLQETVIGGGDLTSAKAILVHKNDMGASFVLESVSYALDGAPIFTRVDTTDALDEQREIEIFNGRIVPGTHQISVRLKYRGSGFGVFSYLEGYKFNVQSSYTFDAQGGKVTRVRVVGFEKGGFTADLKDRPAVRFEEEVTKDQPRRAPAEGEKAPARGASKTSEGGQ